MSIIHFGITGVAMHQMDEFMVAITFGCGLILLTCHQYLNAILKSTSFHFDLWMCQNMNSGFKIFSVGHLQIFCHRFKIYF